MEAGLIIPVFMLFLVVGIVVLMVLRGSSKRKAQASAWQAFAQKYGGQFTPASGAFSANRIFFQQHTQITLESLAVSVMQAAGKPYLNNGGNFTIAKAFYPMGNGPNILLENRQPPTPGMLPPQAERAYQQLPPGAAVWSGPQEAVVVLEGVVSIEQPLYDALTIVSSLTAPQT